MIVSPQPWAVRARVQAMEALYPVPSPLSDVGLFRDMPEAFTRHTIGSAKRRVFPAGRTLMRQGEPSDVMHIILVGRVQVKRSHPDLPEPTVLAELGPGETVGEMGVLDNEPRSATVVALETTTTLELSATDLIGALLTHQDLAVTLLRSLSTRICSTNELMAEAVRRQGEGRASGPQQT